MSKTKYEEAVACKYMGSIAANCNNALDFLQAITVKAPRVSAVPLSLHTDNCSRECFRPCLSQNLFPLIKPPTAAPQDHSDLTGFLSDVAMRLQIRNISSQFLRCRLRQTERQNDDTELLQQPNASSWC